MLSSQSERERAGAHGSPGYVAIITDQSIDKPVLPLIEAPLNVLNPNDQVSDPNLILGQVTLARPSRSPDPADVPMQIRLAADLGALSLAGVNLDRDEAAPGDPTLVTLFWQGTKVPPDLRAHLALVDEAHTEAMAWDLPPVRDDWPTTSWRPGDLWRGQHLLRLPAGLESGVYTWQLSMYQPSNPESRIPRRPSCWGN